MTNVKQQEATLTFGGWTTYRKPDKEELDIFKMATEGLLGVEYIPLEVSTQVVNGINYRYKCKAILVVPEQCEYNAIVEIYKPLEGKPVITKITDLLAEESQHSNIAGGWSKFQNLDNEDKEIFNETMKGIVGVEYNPQKVSTQVVAGTNYRFICNATIVSLGSDSYKAMVEIFKPLEGKPVLMGIQRI